MQASARLSSSAAFRKVIAGVSSATTRSCYRTSRGKAHAAPLPAQEPPPKGQKRITKEEKRARIVEFVENYRASNEGKFPRITYIRQQIGGSHYTVREVLQEMVFNHAKLPLDNPKAAPLQGTDEVTEHPMQKDEARVLESQGIVEGSDHSMAEDDAEVAQRQGTVEVSENSLPKDEGKVDQFQGTESESFKDNPKLEESANTVEVTEHPMQKDEARVLESQGTVEGSDHLDDAEVAQRQGTVEVSENSLPKDEGKVDQFQGAESESFKDNPKLEESANTGLLGSLKSFAYGIRNFWKNM